jgi:hypothetical protein
MHQGTTKRPVGQLLGRKYKFLGVLASEASERTRIFFEIFALIPYCKWWSWKEFGRRNAQLPVDFCWRDGGIQRGLPPPPPATALNCSDYWCIRVLFSNPDPDLRGKHNPDPENPDPDLLFQLFCSFSYFFTMEKNLFRTAFGVVLNALSDDTSHHPPTFLKTPKQQGQKMNFDFFPIFCV